MFPGIAPDLFQLGARFFNNRRDLVHLFVGQAQLPTQPVLHALRDHSVRMLPEHEVMPDCHRHENTGGAAGDEDEQKTGDQFPLQRAVHGATSSWMIESATAYSFAACEIMSELRANSRQAPPLAKSITATAANAIRRKSRPNAAPF